MGTRTLEADDLVVGCGAAGMAFTDSLISASDADVIMLGRRHAPGGHGNEAYPFVRLHQPSAYHGVNSLALGSEAIDRHGPNRGMYEQASAPEICAYYDRVMQQHLLPSGQVRHFPMCDYVGEHRLVSRLSGDEYAERHPLAQATRGLVSEPSVRAGGRTRRRLVRGDLPPGRSHSPGNVGRGVGYAPCSCVHHDGGRNDLIRRLPENGHLV